jgi:hypothetical protein
VLDAANFNEEDHFMMEDVNLLRPNEAHLQIGMVNTFSSQSVISLLYVNISQRKELRSGISILLHTLHLILLARIKDFRSQ